MSARAWSFEGPDAFVMAPPGSGAEALVAALRAHPDACVPTSAAPAFYADIPTGWSDYARHFATAGARRTIDAAWEHLACPGAILRIAVSRPDARIVVVLHDPVARAVSHHASMRHAGREPLRDLAAALDAEPARLAAGWGWSYGYGHCGLYAERVASLLRHLPREQVLFVDAATLSDRPTAAWALVCAHLGLRADAKRPPMGGDGAAAPPGPSLRARLLDLYAADHARVAALTHLDLRHWATVTAPCG